MCPAIRRLSCRACCLHRSAAFTERSPHMRHGRRCAMPPTVPEPLPQKRGKLFLRTLLSFRMPSRAFWQARQAVFLSMVTSEQPQGDRILIPSIDVDWRLEGDLTTGPWTVDQCSTLLLWLKYKMRSPYLETDISGPRLIRAWKRRHWIEYCFRSLKHLLAVHLSL